MGSIWVARHLLLGVDVAIKFLFAHALVAPSGAARFLREARSAARLRSPHVVRAYDYDFLDGTPYIAMELLEGETIDQRLRRQGKLELLEAATILRHVAKGLGEAHALGIVHRDLKPSNVFLARAGEDEVVKLLDFGIAKETHDLRVDDRTASGVLVGSPHHMSPEQTRGGEVDARSDLWSLGVLLFECVAGRRPFKAENIVDLVTSICTDEIPAPSTFSPELSPAIDRFFETALARNPAMRFQSAREMADAFDEAVSPSSGDRLHLRAEATPPPRRVGRDQTASGVGVVARADPTHDVSMPYEVRPAASPSPLLAGRRSAHRYAAVLSVAAASALSLGYFAFVRGNPTGPARGTPPTTTSEVGEDDVGRASPQTRASSLPAPPAAAELSAEAPVPNPPKSPAPVSPTSAAPTSRPRGRLPSAAATGARPASKPPTRPEENGPFF
jgi:serine/threonine-protein kinase